MATLLDPRYKNQFFTSEERRNEAENTLLQILKIEAQLDEQVEEEVTVTGDVDSANNDVHMDGDISAMFAAIRKKANSQSREGGSQVDVFGESAEKVVKEYLAGKLEDKNLKFWAMFQQRKDGKYSRALVRLAKKYLTPPPTSTSVERLFSTAGNISEDRPRLLPENLEKLLFLRENLGKNNIDIDY